MSNDGGLSRIQQRMAMIPRRVREAVAPELIKQGSDLAVTMRILAPRDTGALQESIEVTGPGQATPAYSQPGGSTVVPDTAVAVTVGNTDVRYPHLVEYGTKNAPAHPFFWPAVRMQRKKMTGAIKRAISRAVRDNWGKR